MPITFLNVLLTSSATGCPQPWPDPGGRKGEDMATASVAERADIHKSCKAIEGLVNLLNDYCDATTAIVAIQKKLAKAMREAASIRCNSEAASKSHVILSHSQMFDRLFATSQRT